MAGDPDTAEQTPVEPSPRTGDDGRLDGITGIAGLPVVPDDVPDEGLGIEVSGVRLVRLLGEGGMGRVYEGVQAQPRRTVAVKLLRAGLVSNAMLRRFEIEADALGRLRHPGVAAVYAAGGRPVPHLVMEFVAGGLPITSHAAAHRLGIRDRVALMAAVSDAVAHGHQRGVIHRDLKPSNILVEPTGQPKVIDFGIARIVDPQADPAAESETTTGQLLGTAAYMAPEQFTGPADAVDVRTDVHALGVVLYELVTGRPPWILPAGNPLEAARIICQDVPSPPSRLVAGLPRPLDAITASCLAKDRADRYPTAAELAADLRRFLAGEPVVAAPPRALDAVRRFAARHRPVAAAIAATFMMLLVGSGVISWLAVDAARQRVRAEQRAAEADLARASADEQRRRAEQALEVVAGTFRLWDPGTDGRAVTAARLVSRAVENAIDRFEGDADTKARVLFALGRGAIAVEEYPAAVRALTACAALPRDRAALEPTRGAVLANLAQAMQLGGDPTQAARTFERAIEELRFSMGPDHDDTLLTICNLASLRRQLGDAEGSITLLRPALEQVESRFGRDDPQVLSLRTNLALALVDRGRLGEAVDEFRAVLDGRLRVLGADHSDTIRAHRNLGGCLARLERFAEAAESLSTAHAGLLRVYGHDHREVILCEYDLAISLEAAGEVNRAIPLYKRVLAAVRGRNGADSAQAREVETRLRAAEETAEKDD